MDASNDTPVLLSLHLWLKREEIKKNHYYISAVKTYIIINATLIQKKQINKKRITSPAVKHNFSN